MQIIGFAIVAFLAYVAAAPLTEHISMQPALTHWDNLWTYVWWIGSFFVWSIIAGGVVLLCAAVVAGAESARQRRQMRSWRSRL